MRLLGSKCRSVVDHFAIICALNSDLGGMPYCVQTDEDDATVYESPLMRTAPRTGKRLFIIPDSQENNISISSNLQRLNRGILGDITNTESLSLDGGLITSNMSPPCSDVVTVSPTQMESSLGSHSPLVVLHPILSPDPVMGDMQLPSPAEVPLMIPAEPPASLKSREKAAWRFMGRDLFRERLLEQLFVLGGRNHTCFNSNNLL